MKFQYTRFMDAGGNAPDVWRPMLTVRVRGPAGSAALDMLVDSGSDETLMPLYLLEQLGVHLRPADTELIGIGGNVIATHVGEVQLEVGESKFLSRVVASDAFHEQLFVLGHKDFLNLHWVALDAPNRAFFVSRGRH